MWDPQSLHLFLSLSLSPVITPSLLSASAPDMFKPPSCLLLSFSRLLPSRPRFLFSLTFFPHPPSLLSSLPLPPFVRSRSLTHCFLLPQIKLYRGRIHGQPTPLLRPPFPTSSHTATIILPPSPHLYLPAYLHISPSPLSLLFLSLTQNEQINYVAMLGKEEITAVQDDKTGWWWRDKPLQSTTTVLLTNYKAIDQHRTQTELVQTQRRNHRFSFLFYS